MLSTLDSSVSFRIPSRPSRAFTDTLLTIRLEVWLLSGLMLLGGILLGESLTRQPCRASFIILITPLSISVFFCPAQGFSFQGLSYSLFFLDLDSSWIQKPWSLNERLSVSVSALPLWISSRLGVGSLITYFLSFFLGLIWMFQGAFLVTVFSLCLQPLESLSIKLHSFCTGISRN